MKTIFVMGAFFDTNQEDINSYSLVKQAFLEKFKNVKIIEPFDIENYQKDFLKNNPDKSFLDSIIAMVNYDLDMVKKSDLLFVNLTNKSFGVGMELGIAKEFNKKAVFIAKENTQISNMVLGGFSIEKVNYYSSFQDIKNIINRIEL